jgi:hypothetical protein
MVVDEADFGYVLQISLYMFVLVSVFFFLFFFSISNVNIYSFLFHVAHLCDCILTLVDPWW